MNPGIQKPHKPIVPVDSRAAPPKTRPVHPDEVAGRQAKTPRATGTKGELANVNT